MVKNVQIRMWDNFKYDLGKFDFIEIFIKTIKIPFEPQNRTEVKTNRIFWLTSRRLILDPELSNICPSLSRKMWLDIVKVIL